MKKTILLLYLVFCTINSAFSQTHLVKQWDYRFGGIGSETISYLEQTTDEGFIMAGYTQNSDSSGDISQHTRGGLDCWLVKTDSAGNKKWDKRYGGNGHDYINSIHETSDKGYIFGGYVASDSGFDVTQNSRGASDYWLVKIDSLGSKQWDSRFGGTWFEYLSCLEQTNDKGYVCGGTTESDSSGDISQLRKGARDFWIVKTDSVGVKQWDKRYGGTSFNFFSCLHQTHDGSYLLGGTTYSDSSIDVSQPSIDTSNTIGFIGDFWIIKIDSVGNKLWDKRFGGNFNDRMISFQETLDKGYILFGVTQSDSFGDVSQPCRDTSSLYVFDRGDYWIVKTDSLGNKEWDSRFGGNKQESGGSIKLVHGGNYLISGTTSSNASGDKTENNLGLTQSWIILTDSLGRKLWDKTLFTRGEDEYGTYAIQSSDLCFVISNSTNSDTGGYKTQMSRGSYDYWIVKSCDTTTTIGVPEIDREINSLLVFPNPATDKLYLDFQTSNSSNQIKVYNLLGEIQIEEMIETKPISINTRNLSSGIYFIELISDQKKYYASFIKQ